MADNKIQSEPGVAEAVNGTVIQDGPDGVAVTMTPHAAEVTSQRLMQASEAARRQNGEVTPTETGIGRASIGVASLAVIGLAAYFFRGSRKR